MEDIYKEYVKPGILFRTSRNISITVSKKEVVKALSVKLEKECTH